MLQLTQAAPPEIHVSGVGGVTTIPRRIMPSCRRGHVSSIDDAEQMRDAISCAQLEGKRARRRVQVPCLVASTLLFASAIVVVLTAGRVDQTYFVVLPCSLVTSVVILLFAVLTTDERLTSFAAGSIAMQFMVAAILTAVLALASTLRTGAMSGSCVQTMGEPCWDVILDAVQFSIGSLALLLKGSSLLVEMAWRGSRGRILLEFLWREVRQTCAIAFVVLFPIALVRITTFGGLSERATRFLVAGLWFGCTALVLSTPKLRTRVQSALAARGGALLTAASVAAYIGRADPTEMVRNAEATFRAVPLPLVTLAHLQSNVPDPELYRLTVPVRFSQCDAFVSHSWADDPALKFAALRAWGVRFERLFKRAPLVWIDRFCLPQETIEDGVQMLPCYTAGCTSLLALAGPTFVTRLWCIIEIFIFVCMGSPPSMIEVIALTADLSIDDFDAMKAQCSLSTDRERMLATIELAAGGVRGFNEYVHKILSAAKALTIAQLAEQGRNASHVGRTSREMRSSRVAASSH